jgi:hypothetical protein
MGQPRLTEAFARSWRGRSRRVVALVIFACCLAVPAAALAATAGTPPSHRAVTATREMLGLCLLGLVLPSALVWDMLIGKDKRVSTSKTTAAVWTYLIASAFLGFVVAKFIGQPQALNKIMHSGLAGQYGVLIGGPLGAAIAAKGIVTNQISKNPAAKSAATGNLSPLQLVQNDTGETDLEDFQYIIFNLVAMVYFVGTLVQSPTVGFPHIPDVLLAHQHFRAGLRNEEGPSYHDGHSEAQSCGSGGRWDRHNHGDGPPSR